MDSDYNVKGIDIGEILKDFSPQDNITLNIFDIADKDIFATHSRKAWNKQTEARCDFKPATKLCKQSGIYFISTWQKSILGRTLTDIKTDDDMINHFAESACNIIADILGDNLNKGSYAICTTPRRRHLKRNFATLITMRIADFFNIPFYMDVALARNRQRVNAVFTLNTTPAEQNIIVYDDFVTTGQTFKAMYNILNPLGKNMIFFAGINNN